MALSKEDHGDVKNALGKAVANKISKVTRDKTGPYSKGSELTSKAWNAHDPKGDAKFKSGFEAAAARAKAARLAQK